MSSLSDGKDFKEKRSKRSCDEEFKLKSSNRKKSSSVHKKRKRSHKSQSKKRRNSIDSRHKARSQKKSRDRQHKSKSKKQRHRSDSEKLESPRKRNDSRRKSVSNELSPEIKNHSVLNDHYDASGFKLGEKQTIKHIFGYTNTENPFMDSTLTDCFVWKKNKKQVKRSIEENAMELESVQKRQKEREKFREERQLEQELLQRMKEAEGFVGRKSDATFDIEQARNRSKIRIEEDRAKPIDLLIEYVYEEENLASSNADVINHEPADFIVGLNGPDLEDLVADIGAYRSNMMDRNDKNSSYWEDLLTVTEAELEQLRTGTRLKETAGKSMETVAELTNMLQEGTITEAEKVIEDARDVLNKPSNEGHIDPGFYQFFVKLGSVLLAHRRLHERHIENLRTNLDKLRQQQGIVPQQKQKCSDNVPSSSVVTEKKSKPKEKPEEDETSVINGREQYERCYSPVLLQDSQLTDEVSLYNVIYDATDDAQKLAYLRQSFLRLGTRVDVDGESTAQLDRANTPPEDVDDGVEQMTLAPQTFLWSDKYRPRKPRLTKAVNIGYDWNKYNKTHYDSDNPPPKIVQGYKFNILYPDLIDKTRTPTYTLTPWPEDDQYTILTFKAGPPYEDVAFKIVNREWETNERYGFRCQFYRDTLQLNFQFRRYRYRK